MRRTITLLLTLGLALGIFAAAPASVSAAVPCGGLAQAQFYYGTVQNGGGGGSTGSMCAPAGTILIADRHFCDGQAPILYACSSLSVKVWRASGQCWTLEVFRDAGYLGTKWTVYIQYNGGNATWLNLPSSIAGSPGSARLIKC